MNCSGNEVCVDGVNSFICECVTGYHYVGSSCTKVKGSIFVSYVLATGSYDII